MAAKKPMYIWIGKGIVVAGPFLNKKGKPVPPQRGDDVSAKLDRLDKDSKDAIIKSLLKDQKIVDANSELGKLEAANAQREKTLAAAMAAVAASDGKEGGEGDGK